MDATTKGIRKEGWLVFWNGEWGHIQSAECKDTKYFLHVKHFQSYRAPKLGERIQFFAAPAFRSKNPNRMVRAINARPWTPDDPAGEPANAPDVAEFLRAVGEI
jgi:hypothetical protein